MKELQGSSVTDLTLLLHRLGVSPSATHICAFIIWKGAGMTEGSVSGNSEKGKEKDKQVLGRIMCLFFELPSTVTGKTCPLLLLKLKDSHRSELVHVIAVAL